MQSEKISRDRVIVLMAAITTACIAIARAPDLAWHPQFYGEDAIIFWIQEYKSNVYQALGTSYAGYLHTVPRILAWMCHYVSYEEQPRAYWLSAVIISGWTGATIASLQFKRLKSFIIALTVFLVAQPSDDIWACVVNVQWIMASVLPLAAMTATPYDRATRLNLLAFIGLASVTGPFSIAAAPLWIYRGVRFPHDRFGLVLAAAGLAGGTVQGIVISLHASPSEGHSKLSEGVQIAFLKLFGLLIWASFDWRLACLGAALVTTLFILLLRQERVLAAGLLIFGFVEIALVVVKFGARPEVLLAADRYFYPATAMIGSVAAIGIGQSKPVPRVIGGILLGAMVFASVRTGFVKAPFPDFTSSWRAAAPLIGNRDVEVPIAPGSGWSMLIPANP